MSLEERIQELKKPRETQFGDQEITNIEQALQILHELKRNSTYSDEAWQKLKNAIRYLDDRLKDRVKDPEELG